MKLNHQQKNAFRDVMNRANGHMESGNLVACIDCLEKLLFAVEAVHEGRNALAVEVTQPKQLNDPTAGSWQGKS